MSSLRVFQVRKVRLLEATVLALMMTSFASNSSSHSEIHFCGKSAFKYESATSTSFGNRKLSTWRCWQYAQITASASSTESKAILFRIGLYSRKTSMWGPHVQKF